jgi:hypothetical protein
MSLRRRQFCSFVDPLCTIVGGGGGGGGGVKMVLLFKKEIFF